MRIMGKWLGIDDKNKSVKNEKYNVFFYFSKRNVTN